MTWDKLPGTVAAVAAWTGTVLAIITWIVTCAAMGMNVNVGNLGGNVPMLCGNLVAIFSSLFICVVGGSMSTTTYDWKSMAAINLIKEAGEDVKLAPDMKGDERRVPHEGQEDHLQHERRDEHPALRRLARALGPRRRLHEELLRVLGLHRAALGPRRDLRHHRAAALRVVRPDHDGPVRPHGLHLRAPGAARARLGAGARDRDGRAHAGPRDRESARAGGGARGGARARAGGLRPLLSARARARPRPASAVRRDARSTT